MVGDLGTIFYDVRLISLRYAMFNNVNDGLDSGTESLGDGADLKIPLGSFFIQRGSAVQT